MKQKKRFTLALILVVAFSLSFAACSAPASVQGTYRNPSDQWSLIAIGETVVRADQMYIGSVIVEGIAYENCSAWVVVSLDDLVVTNLGNGVYSISGAVEASLFGRNGTVYLGWQTIMFNAKLYTHENKIETYGNYYYKG